VGCSPLRISHPFRSTKVAYMMSAVHAIADRHVSAMHDAALAIHVLCEQKSDVSFDVLRCLFIKNAVLLHVLNMRAGG